MRGSVRNFDCLCRLPGRRISASAVLMVRAVAILVMLSGVIAVVLRLWCGQLC